MINRLDRLIRAQATTTDNYYQEIISRIVQLESDNKLIKTERDSLRRELKQNYTADAEIQKMIEDMHTENISLRRELAEAREILIASDKDELCSYFNYSNDSILCRQKGDPQTEWCAHCRSVAYLAAHPEHTDQGRKEQ
jgi:septal ring factor EnvC (AmiA/AmiB activator)